MGRETALLVVMVVSMQLMLISGYGEGGPSTFGYDASLACMSQPAFPRQSRARIEDLPCDFRRDNWCTVAGNAYPWHAVRRFVQENQGMMRRMYGDEKHINVYKGEFAKNDIEVEVDDPHYYRDDRRHRQYDDPFEYSEHSRYNEIIPPGYYRQGRSGRSIGTGASSKNRDPSRPHPNETPNDPNSQTKNDTDNKESFITSSSSSTSTPSTTSSSTASYSTTANSIPITTSTFTTPTTTQSLTTWETTTPYQSTSPSSSSSNPNSTSTLSMTSPNPVTPNASFVGLTTTSLPNGDVTTTPRQNQNLSINNVAGQIIDRSDVNVDELTDIPVAEELVAIAEEEAQVMEIEPDGEPEVNGEVMNKSTSAISEDKEVEQQQEQLLSLNPQQSTEQDSQEQQFRPRPEYKPQQETQKPEIMETQLYQDVAAKDKDKEEEKEEPLVKLRGINACPVKEEVVAPFWANNTRGEVLALLNLYPFEQYVHWEKCTHEHKQMYCRDGCRCEQQYRLHRLLAYDPNNDCRGIFSDWFKFPSCCICRCYSIPLEFRVTSRSPRGMLKKKVKIRTPRYQRKF